MTKLSIPDMSCEHCKSTVEAALATVPGTREVEVDLSARQVTIGGDAPGAALLAALSTAGYPAEILG